MAEREPARKKEIVALTPDASTREYFRDSLGERYGGGRRLSGAFDAWCILISDVTRLFLECDLPVPQVHDAIGETGIIVQEDLGNRQLCQVFEEVSEEERETLLEQAIDIIARIQAATAKAIERDSIVSRLAFDEAKFDVGAEFFLRTLLWQLSQRNI